MKLYNSLTKQIDEFTPQKDDEISIYTCGPTVYERAHIGNLASFIYADTLKRTLKLAFPNHAIKHVMNVTDVDDKTIAAGREKYPDSAPMDALKKLTSEYEQLFKNDLEKLGIDINDITFVFATQNIEAMQNLIRKLVSSGFAYIADDGIYFSIEKYKQAGKKYGQLVEITVQSTGQARVKNDEYDKDNVHDFALWKAQKENEPAWDFEIDGKNIKGRPGWHIECSAMSVNELGQPFDIHTGGVDLKFPHHENEIAQSTANNGDLLARFFFHSEHMLIDGKKMSKSLGNFLTLEDSALLRKNPLALRLLALNGSYRNQLNFSNDSVAEALINLENLYERADLKFQLLPNEAPDKNRINNWLKESEEKIIANLTNDLNTHEALTELLRLTRNVSIARLYEINANAFDNYLADIKNVLGIDLTNRQDISKEQMTLFDEREEARQNQDWQKADQLRKQLAEQGVEINDTPHGPIWRRTFRTTL